MKVLIVRVGFGKGLQGSFVVVEDLASALLGNIIALVCNNCNNSRVWMSDVSTKAEHTRVLIDQTKAEHTRVLLDEKKMWKLRDAIKQGAGRRMRAQRERAV